MSTQPQSQKPQLLMSRPDLAALPGLTVPAGYTMRSSRPQDGVHWAAIINATFGTDLPS